MNANLRDEIFAKAGAALRLERLSDDKALVRLDIGSLTFGIGQPRNGLEAASVLRTFRDALTDLLAAAATAPADLLEAVDTLLETAPCDCSHKKRYEEGGHKSYCYLFDMDIARSRMLAASPSTTEKPVRAEMLRQCAASGQMDSAQIHAHEVAGDLQIPDGMKESGNAR